MRECNAQNSHFSRVINQIALELIYLEPGKDIGLLPINSLLNELEDLKEVHPHLISGVARARECIDYIFTTESAAFTSQDIELFKQWTLWAQDSIRLLNEGASPSPFNSNPETPSPAPPVSHLSPPEHIAALTPPEDDFAIRLELERDGDLLREFVSESQEHLANIEKGILKLEENPEHEETLNSIFRAFHTFKGGSGFLNLKPINKLAHELESLLEKARQKKLKITSPIIDLILGGRDLLEQFVTAIDAQLNGAGAGTPILIPIQHLLDSLSHTIHFGGSETAFIERTETQFFTREDGEGGLKAIRAVKVDIQKLDNLLDLIGEMVIAQSLVGQDFAVKGSGDPRLSQNLAQLRRVTRDLQRTAMSLRMVPIRKTFSKMERLVRDVALKAGKEVKLIISGEETEADRTIVAEISDPLIHMIRNAIDHGIEKPENRLALGKPSCGTIYLNAFYQGGNLMLSIQDDGAGLDRERIRTKAIEKGLITPDATLSEKEIFGLIFAPGFSTAEQITDISGRGVGMDVVRRNIEKIRGKVDIDSRKGCGTTFTISLPLTLAIIDGLIVRVGEERFILPTLSVRESFRPTPEMITRIGGRDELVDVRGQLLPLLRLKQLFSGQPDLSDPSASTAIIIESNGAHRCLLVDDLIGKQEIVIKSLDAIFSTNPFLAGAGILGDGRVGLILDINNLVHFKNALHQAA
ncbi:MAG: chemotaxis protein CheA [Verrucomicrobiota bacterium]|nr:chemotaxis protein CheA [Verrucomicrobiota bacterium]